MCHDPLVLAGSNRTHTQTYEILLLQLGRGVFCHATNFSRVNVLFSSDPRVLELFVNDDTIISVSIAKVQIKNYAL